jgi:hypothetical protein
MSATLGSSVQRFIHAQVTSGTSNPPEGVLMLSKRLPGFLLVTACFAALTASAAMAQSAIVGVNVVGTDQASDQTRNDLLEQLQRYHVKTIRTSLGGHGDRYTTFVVTAFQHGIGSVIFVSPSGGATSTAHTLPADKAAGRPWPVPALSDADPEGFRKWFASELATLEAAGVRVTAFELGNELNTPRFNADFGAEKTPGRTLRLSELENPDDAQAVVVAGGYRNYLKILAAMKDVRDYSTINRKTPILSGMSAVMAAGRTSVTIPDSIEFLRQNGLDKLADGYGVHTYPTGDPRVSTAARADQLVQSGVLSECKQGTKPCWMTEWGLPNKDESCPLDDAARANAAQAERAALQQFVKQGRLAAILYYSWSGVPPFSWQHNNTNSNKDPYTIFRCGALTDAGKVALNPI